jgi:hypothetical protein
VTLERCLANWAERAEHLCGAHAQVPAATLKDCVAELRASAEPFVRYLTESEAHLKSGWSLRRLRRWHAQGVPLGLAKTEGPRRLYLDISIPQRVHPSAVRAEARDAARRAS